MKKFGIFCFVITLILGLDVLTKKLTVQNIAPLFSSIYPYGGIGIFQGFCGIDFCLVHATNTGAAWGMLSHYTPYLVTLRLVLILSLCLYMGLGSLKNRRFTALSLVVAGALGNVLDYLLYGHVIDMFAFKIGSYHFPVFNIADSSIFFGICSLFFEKLPAKKAATS